MDDEFVFGQDFGAQAAAAEPSQIDGLLEVPTFVKYEDFVHKVAGETLPCTYWRATLSIRDILEVPLTDRIPLTGAPYYWREHGNRTREIPWGLAKHEVIVPEWFTAAVQHQFMQHVDRGLPWFMTKVLFLGNGYGTRDICTNDGQLRSILGFTAVTTQSPIVSLRQITHVTETQDELVQQLRKSPRIMLRARIRDSYYGGDWCWALQKAIRREVSPILQASLHMAVPPYAECATDLGNGRKFDTQWLTVKPYSRRYLKTLRSPKRATYTDTPRAAECYACMPIVLYKLAVAVQSLLHARIHSRLNAPTVSYPRQTKDWRHCARDLCETLAFARKFNVYDAVRRLDEFEKLLEIWRTASPRRRKWIASYSEEQAAWLEYESKRKRPKRVPKPRIIAADVPGYFVPTPKTKAPKSEAAQLQPV